MLLEAAEMKFVTAINCMDGRVQEPLIRWAKENFGAEYVDMITEAGPDGILARTDHESILRRVSISIEKHGSRVIIVAGHHDCAGNPVSDDKHLDDIRMSVERLKRHFNGVDVVGVWIDSTGSVERLPRDE